MVSSLRYFAAPVRYEAGPLDGAVVRRSCQLLVDCMWHLTFLLLQSAPRLAVRLIDAPDECSIVADSLRSLAANSGARRYAVWAIQWLGEVLPWSSTDRWARQTRKTVVF